MVPIVLKAAKLPAFIDVVPPPALRREHVIGQKHLSRFTRAYMKVSRSIYDTDTKDRLVSAYGKLLDGKMTIEEVVNVVEWFNPADPLAVKLWELLGASLDRAYIGIIEDAGESEVKVHGWHIKFTVQKSGKADVSVPVNPFSIAWVRLKSGSLVREISDQQRTLLRELISSGFEQGERSDAIIEDIEQNVGLTVREQGWVWNKRAFLSKRLEGPALEKAVARYAALTLRRRAKKIARTETIDAYAQGLDDSWGLAKQEGAFGDDVMQEWVEVPGSARTCKICRGLGGQRAPIGEAFVSEFIGEVVRPPAHPQCIVGDSVVAASGVLAKSERLHQGDLLTIRTASGNVLTCTPNHPILGDSGWLPAKSFQVGSHVVSSIRADWAIPGVVDNQNDAPPMIQKISDSGFVPRSVLPRREPLEPRDFHNDAIGSETAVIWSHGDPRDEITDPPIRHPHVKLEIYIQRIQTFCLDCLRSFMFGDVKQLGYFLRGYGSLPGGYGLAPVAGFNPVADEHSFDSVIADTEGFAQRSLADSSLVFADKVVSVDSQFFRTPVFNLETATGAYVSQGIVTHNCRCTKILVFPDDIDESLDQANSDAIAARATRAPVQDGGKFTPEDPIEFIGAVVEADPTLPRKSLEVILNVFRPREFRAKIFALDRALSTNKITQAAARAALLSVGGPEAVSVLNAIKADPELPQRIIRALRSARLPRSADSRKAIVIIRAIKRVLGSLGE